MKTICVRLVVLLLLYSAVCFSSPAQGNSPQAQVSGRLVDSSGARLGGVEITILRENDPAARKWTVTSSSEGVYSVALPPGNYRVRFQRESFATRDVFVELGANEQRKLDLRLELQWLSARVIVTAETEPILADQTTASVSVITKEEIDARRSVTLTDALLFTPGIAIGRTGPEGGTASVFLNGGNSNFVKVLVDGAPINPPGAAVDFSDLTLHNIDKVEIVRGAESAIYGTDAVSGVIQLITHRGETRTPEFSAFAEGGDYSSGRGGAQLSGLLGAFDYSAGASYFSTDGQNVNDGFIDRTLSGNFGYKFSEKNHLRLSLRNADSFAGIPGQTLLVLPSLYQKYFQHVFSANARWDLATGQHWRHAISGSESYARQHDYNPLQSYYATDPNAFCPQANPTAVATAESCDFTYDDRLQYNRASVNAQTTYLLTNFAATAGYEYEVENAFLTSTNVPHARRNNQAGYLDFRYRPQRRISLNFGGRAEANGYFGTRVVPRAGVALALRYNKGTWGDTLLRGFYGGGIKEPRFDQTFGDNFGDFGNPLLKPEASKTWTAGLEQKLLGNRARVTAEYFASKFYDIVSFEFCSSFNNYCNLTSPMVPSGFGYYFNTDRARARGLNLSGDLRLAHWMTISGNYTYDDSLVIASPNSFDPSEVPGNRLIRRPANAGSLTWALAFQRLDVTVGGYFSGIRTDSDFLGLSTVAEHDPGYARFDAAASYRVGHGISLYARATNLFDKRYEDALGYPALGRDGRIGVKYTFSGRN